MDYSLLIGIHIPEPRAEKKNQKKKKKHTDKQGKHTHKKHHSQSTEEEAAHAMRYSTRQYGSNTTMVYSLLEANTEKERGKFTCWASSISSARTRQRRKLPTYGSAILTLNSQVSTHTQRIARSHRLDNNIDGEPGVLCPAI